MSANTGRRRLQFSLKLLLVIIALVAAYLAGRWGGYRAGRESVLNEGWRVAPLYDPKHPDRW